MRKILIAIGNLFDIGWWADKINQKLGIYEWAKKVDSVSGKKA